MKDTTVIMITILVLHVIQIVNIVLMLLTTVLNVSHQESTLQVVLAQMVTSIMVTLVSVVLTNVVLVLPEKIVLPVLISDLILHLVNVQKDIMKNLENEFLHFVYFLLFAPEPPCSLCS